jgi:hypothetical protein
MKKLTLLILLVIYSIFPQVSFAHVLKTDESIGAVIHIDPEDDPIVGQPSNIYFEFKDRQDKFRANECDCKFIVLKNGEQVFMEPLFGNDSEPTLTSSAVTYTFPEKNIYQIQLKGSPKDGISFATFTLHYDIRVEREIEKSNNETSNVEKYSISASWYLYLIIGLGILSVVTIVIWGRKKY